MQQRCSCSHACFTPVQAASECIFCRASTDMLCSLEAGTPASLCEHEVNASLTLASLGRPHADRQTGHPCKLGILHHDATSDAAFSRIQRASTFASHRTKLHPCRHCHLSAAGVSPSDAALLVSRCNSSCRDGERSVQPAHPLWRSSTLAAPTDMPFSPCACLVSCARAHPAGDSQRQSASQHAAQGGCGSSAQPQTRTY